MTTIVCARCGANLTPDGRHTDPADDTHVPVTAVLDESDCGTDPDTSTFTVTVTATFDAVDRDDAIAAFREWANMPGSIEDGAVVQEEA